MNLALLNTLDDADRIVATDLYPARCRTVIAALAEALRSMTTDLAESRVYGLALVAELKARAEKTDAFVAMAASMDGDIEAILSDPIAVHANMLRGAIAKPTIEQIVHLYGVDALCKAMAPMIVREAGQGEPSGNVGTRETHVGTHEK